MGHHIQQSVRTTTALQWWLAMTPPRLYALLASAVATAALLGGVWWHGWHTRDVEAQRDAGVLAVATLQHDVTLAGRLRDSDDALRAAQSRAAEVRTVEITKYVTKYRDRIVREPVITKCINDSGLLDILNVAMPTVEADTATGGADDHTAADATLPGGGDSRHGGN